MKILIPPLIKIKNENNQLQFTNKMLLMTQKKPTKNMKINSNKK